MKIDLKPNQIKLLDTLLGLDLEAMGMSVGQQRTAHTIHMMLHGADADLSPLPPRAHEPLRALRMSATARYNHEDK